MKLNGQVSIKPNLAPFFKYEHEFTSYSHTLGHTPVFGGSWTLYIPESTGTKIMRGISHMYIEMRESTSFWTARDGDRASGCSATWNAE